MAIGYAAPTSAWLLRSPSAREAFSIDCFALDLGGFDLVLGVQWLRTLGPIVWDFDALAMSFWYNGRSHHWTGVHRRGLAARAIADPRAVLEDLL
jgi:hypothetical protein